MKSPLGSILTLAAVLATSPLLAQGLEFLDEFEGIDGDPPAGWTIPAVQGGIWALEGGELSVEARGAAEAWIWQDQTFGGDITLDVRVRFEENPGGVVGRHGGMAFFASFPGEPQTRGLGMSGYTLDWIDRCDPGICDHGIRLIRWDNGVALPEGTLLPVNLVTAVDPPEAWRVVVRGERMSIFLDDQLIGEVVDATYRDGLIGFWAYNNSNHMHYDDLRVLSPRLLVKRDLPPAILPGTTIPVALEVTALDVVSSATIRERIPRFWTASNPSAPGRIETDAAGRQTLVWELTGGVGAETLGYELIVPSPFANVAFVGSTVVGDGQDYGITGDQRVTGGSDGFALEALSVQLRQSGGAAPGLSAIRADYLTDGDASSEATVAPAQGESISPDFLGASPSSGPAPPIGATWARTTAQPGGWFQLNNCGDNCLSYVAVYVENITAEPLRVAVGSASDDAQQILLDGEEIWINNVARGSGRAQVQDRSPLFDLTPGKHLLLQKVFEGGGDHNSAMRIEDEDGNPLPAPAIGAAVRFSLDPAGYEVGNAFVLRDIPDTLDPGESGTVVLKLRVKEGVSGAAIVETVPEGFSISAPSDGGVVAGRTITWDLSGTVSSRDLTYRIAIPAGSPDAAFQGTATLGGEAGAILGDTAFVRGVMNAQGFIKHWLVLGPLDTLGTWLGDLASPHPDINGPSATPENGDIRRDYITDGTITEANVRPFDGMRMNPSFGGDGISGALAKGLEVPGGDCVPVTATWERFVSPTGTFDNNAYFRMDVNSHATLAGCYVTNITGAPLSASVAFNSDDAFIVFLDGVEVGVHEPAPCSAAACGRGYGAEDTVANVFPLELPPGESFLLTRVHDGAGGSGHRLRFQDGAGAPIGSDKLVVSLRSTVSPPAATVTRLLSSPSYRLTGDPLLVTLRVETTAARDVTIREVLPVDWSAEAISDGGALAGGEISWSVQGVNGTRDLTYRLVPGECPGGGAFCGNGLSASEYTVSGVTHSLKGDEVFRRDSRGTDDLGSWDVRDIGSVGGGAQRVGDHGVDLTGRGAGVKGTRDEFRFTSVPESGDFSISARIDCLDDPGAGGRAGLMVRDTFDTFSAHAFFALSSTSTTGGVGTLVGGYRRTTQKNLPGSTLNIPKAEDRDVQSLPVWLKLERIGNRLSFQRSNDGSEPFLEIASRDIVASSPTSAQIQLRAETLVGLLVTGGGAGGTRAAFRDVSGPAFTAEPPQAPTLTTATGGTKEVALTWTAPAAGGTPTGYAVYRSANAGGGPPYDLLAEVPALQTSYADGGLADDTSYCYIVRTKRGSAESGDSNQLCARTAGGGTRFRRGDTDVSGGIDLSDAIGVLQHLFLGGVRPQCWDAADTDDNGVVDISDPISNLQYQFLGGAAPAAPGPSTCGSDVGLESPDLGCGVSC